ncbi:hypothetical protein QVD17_00770 [Tagetes erecta]|uniref:Uncharacterized protein n=1 Tax=Tagetes erecta TaxID=13708 RepID=A0AAD8P0V2_TARER|nr:hypothetical protein QVD17_00770 [Tagetes erecta]
MGSTLVRISRRAPSTNKKQVWFNRMIVFISFHRKASEQHISVDNDLKFSPRVNAGDQLRLPNIISGDTLLLRSRYSGGP